MVAADDLKIQLEGGYERIEGEVIRWEGAVRSLAAPLWDQRHEWRHIRDNTAQLRPHLLQLAKKVAAGEADEAQLVSRLKNAQALFHEYLDFRLRGLGETVEVDTHEHKVERLLANLPVRYAKKHWGSYLPFRLLPAFVVGALLSVWVQSPLGMFGALCLLPVSYFVKSPWLHVVITRRSLIVNRTQWYLSELKWVRVTDGFMSRDTTLSLETRAGERASWTLYMSDLGEVAMALGELGVLVVKD